MIFDWIKSKMSDLRRQYLADKRNEKKAMQVERGTYRDASTFSNSDFEGDYATACKIMKKQMDQRFPDNYHARSQAGHDPLRDYSSERSDAIDKSSAAIARSLRAGDGINQAVKSAERAIDLR